MVQWGPFDGLDGLSREELRQRLQSLQALIARAPIPIAIAHDPECRFIFANSALSALLQTPADTNISLTPPPGHKPPYRIQQNGRDMAPEELPMQYAIAHRRPVSNEIEIVRPDGSVVYVQNDVEPLYDTHGNIYGCVSVCVDHTDRKLAEIALREADRRKDEFLATLSHELRNPLAPIRTAVEVMRLARDNPALVEQARTTLERQLQHLVRITDDLLDISRITQNKVELRRRRIDLLTVLHSAIEATRPLIDSRDQQLKIDLPQGSLWADADPTRLAQAFSNLLHNASKYTACGGEILLSAAGAAGEAVITVTDKGAGIAPDMLPRIFDMFTQLPAHSDHTLGGLGIGLSLAKRMVELHDGTIEARSEGPGRGSTFIVRVPAVQEPASEELSPREDPGASAECRVLIAEDNADAAEMMQMMLRFKGHDVRVARDGVEAVAIATSFEPQIAFLDIGMPVMDGYEAARRIRRILGARILLVALTGWGQDEDKRRSHEAGFDHHVTKPPEPETVERLIARCADGDGTNRRN
jgi:signal transduction histidine kinase/CheY-like chemotaxis protein